MEKPLRESLDSFREEGELRGSNARLTAADDPLAEFATEEVPIRTVPPEPVVPVVSPTVRIRRRTPRSYPALQTYRIPRISTPRTLFALAALATVAIVSVWTLNLLSRGAALDTPVPTDVVASAQPAPPPMTPPVQPVAKAPLPATTTTAPATATPGAGIRRGDARGTETRTRARVSEQPRPAATRNAPARQAAPERVSEQRRAIELPGPQGPPVRAAVPTPAAPRAVDAVPAPVPPPTATTGVRGTESVQSPRLDPSDVAGPGAVPAAAASAVVVAGPPPAPASAAAPPTAPAPRVEPPTAAIQSVLNRYASAFNTLDASGAKSIWPSVNERNLARAFGSLEEQQFDLGACAITVTSPKAVASCSGTARYMPKVGNRNMRTESRQWTFRLEARGETWSIASVESR